MVRHTRRKTGGGWSVGPALSKNTYYIPETKPYNDCFSQGRPGYIQSAPNPGLAQIPMAGGSKCGGSRMRKPILKNSLSKKKSYKRRTNKQSAGCGCMLKGGSRKRSRSSSCGYYSARGGRFQISWAYDIHNEDNGKWWVSRDYVIQIKAKADSPWKTVAAVKGNQSVIGSYALPDELIGFIRIYQLPGGGHADRPNIMWVGQIEVAE